MARTDDYREAKRIAVDELAGETLPDILARGQFRAVAESRFQIPFLDNFYTVTYPDFNFSNQFNPEQEIALQEQVLILHYLLPDSAPQPSGNWVAYREIPGAAMYFSAFAKRAINPLKSVFGSDLTAFKRAAEKISGIPIDFGDAGFEFRFFPRIPVRLIVWRGDDEFPAEANILFDDTIGRILSPEDIAWLAGMLVYRLISCSR